MYGRTQKFHDALARIANASCRPTKALENNIIHGDKKNEFYEPKTWHNRQQLNELKNEIIAERKVTSDPQIKSDLFRLERKIEATLAAGKLLKPQPTKTFSQCFMDAAETTLNTDIFEKIKLIALEKYGRDLRNKK